jgi:hypothetical protein
VNRRFTALFAWLAHFGAFVPQQRGIDREHLVVMVQLVIDEFPDGRVKPRVLGEWERVVNRTGVEKVGVVGGGSPEGIAAAGYVPLTDEHIAAMLTGGSHCTTRRRGARCSCLSATAAFSRRTRRPS